MSLFGDMIDRILSQGDLSSHLVPTGGVLVPEPEELALAPRPVPGVLAPINARDILQRMAQQYNKMNLNWDTSIVDLLKLLGMNSSLEARLELAEELGYVGDEDDSAAMNIWLHRKVMDKLAEHNGTIPEHLKH